MKQRVGVEVAKIRRGLLKFTGVKGSSLLSDSSASTIMGTSRFLQNKSTSDAETRQIQPVFAAFIEKLCCHFVNNFSFCDISGLALMYTFTVGMATDT